VRVPSSAPEPEAADASSERERRMSDTVIRTVPREIAPSDARTTTNVIAAIRPTA
jgi:hypothetical protein